MKQNRTLHDIQKQTIRQFLVALFFIIPTLVVAQNSSIQGKIIDETSGEPLIGASVIIVGTGLGAAADFDGNFLISNIKPGKYTIKASFISYRTDSIRNINVEAGKPTVLNISLTSADIKLQEVEVVAKMNRESENILLLEQKQSLIAIQAVGAKEMSRKGISNAEAAVAQLSGVSKQEGVKNVFVRGLGDRYNTTMLNGFPIPSEDPEYKNISLDFFGSDIIQSIGVSKVFGGSHYGDVGGAAINISSKQLIGDKEINLETSTGINSKTIGTDFILPDGTNYLGVSNNIQPGSNYKYTWEFTNGIDPRTVLIPLNHSYGFSGGKRFNLGENKNPLSFYATASYGSSYSFTDEKVVNTTSTGDIVENLDGYKYSQNINQLVLANLAYLHNQKNQFDYNFMLIHNNNQSVGHYIGENAEFTSSMQPDLYENEGFLRRQQTNDNLLITNQFISKWIINNSLKFDGGISYNFVKGTEPDRKTNNLFRKSATEYELLSGSGTQVRNYTKLIENDINAKFGFTYSMPKKFKDDISSIQLGYDGRYVTDNFSETEYSMTAVNGESLLLTDPKTVSFTLDNLYNQSNLSAGRFQLYNKIVSTYDVTKLINAGYIGLNYQLNQSFTTNIACRVEQVYLNVNYNINAGNVAQDAKTITPFYLLPSINVKYNLNSRNTLRLGASKTYTLPQSKEISPYQYVGMNFKSQGNPKLNPSDNYNADIKWDFYLTGSELISFTGFYKFIKNPIARIEVGNAGGYLTYRNISDQATVAGLETEIRKSILNKADAKNENTNKLSIGLNGSYIYSNLKVKNLELTPDKNSQLEGSAPYILNVDLSYTYSKHQLSTTNSLVINYFSDRIYTIGTQGFEDIIEKGIPTLNIVSITKLNNHLGVKFKAGNLLDPTFTLTRKSNNNTNNIILSQFKKGIDISLGISYEF